MIRDWMHSRFVEQLAGGPSPLHVLHGSYSARLSTAIAAVEDILAAPWIGSFTGGETSRGP